MPEDRELLELAAKAAGMTTAHKWNTERLNMVPPVVAMVVHCDGELVSTGWSSLANDGDALRLAVSIPGLNLQWIIAEAWQAHDNQEKRMAYVRRAITRAAAAIGKAQA
jgi:hypothetical protein